MVRVRVIKGQQQRNSLPVKQVSPFSNSPVHVQLLFIYKNKMEVISRILFKTLFWHLRIGQNIISKAAEHYGSELQQWWKCKAEQSSKNHWTCQIPPTSSPSCDFQRRCSSTNEDCFSLEKRSTILTCFGRNDVRITLVSIEFCCSQIQRADGSEPEYSFYHSKIIHRATFLTFRNIQ